MSLNHQPANLTVPPEGLPASSAVPVGMRLSGRNLVLGLVAFGLIMTGLMLLYWELYTRPFRPLQHAIAAEFENSRPAVIGGRVKSHRAGNPSILRMVVRVPFDPSRDEPAARRAANRLMELASSGVVAIGDYERIEIFLTHHDPERETTNWFLDAPRSVFPLPLEGQVPADTEVKIQRGREGT